jgi:hypothetical protein
MALRRRRTLDDYRVDHASTLDMTPEQIEAFGKPKSGPFRYRKSNNTLTLHIRGEYQIDLDRITEHGHLLGWVQHLSGKSWMTRKYVREFIRIVAEVKGWNFHI